ncbi:hypothetical protein SBOR_8621 [Sclerotinia borealis F-4128]|uniref:ribonuclease H n=1 Tax=Sclerotinia borealis (strain F-4128) TaxID=1432307 RepID=W9C2H5_SCLBF|nr:hypothetical protein SBOR_8621 [Sclerotinia borealis F-4128]
MLEKYLTRERRRDQERSIEDQRIYSRTFDLHQYFSPASRNTKRFIYYDQSKGISMVHDANLMSGDPKSLVVAVDGACPHNGSDLAKKSSFGIFFGQNSTFNLCETIERPEGELHTNNYAELMAVYRALKLVGDSSLLESWRAQDGEGLTAMIMTDSAYVSNSFTTWIWKWRENGFRNAKKETVVNCELIIKIDELIGNLGKRNINVRFWDIPREDNTEADKLANLALEDGDGNGIQK